MKDCPVLVGPDGRIVVFNSMRGTGAIPPLDTASAALANLTGYFTSSDAGVTWSWRDVAIDGAGIKELYHSGIASHERRMIEQWMEVKRP